MPLISVDVSQFTSLKEYRFISFIKDSPIGLLPKMESTIYIASTHFYF